MQEPVSPKYIKELQEMYRVLVNKVKTMDSKHMDNDAVMGALQRMLELAEHNDPAVWFKTCVECSYILGYVQRAKEEEKKNDN